jgi:hypothetical protein
MSNYFNQQNTENFTKKDLEELNTAMNSLIEKFDYDQNWHDEQIKSLADNLSDSWSDNCKTSEKLFNTVCERMGY